MNNAVVIESVSGVLASLSGVEVSDLGCMAHLLNAWGRAWLAGERVDYSHQDNIGMPAWLCNYRDASSVSVLERDFRSVLLDHILAARSCESWLDGIRVVGDVAEERRVAAALSYFRMLGDYGYLVGEVGVMDGPRRVTRRLKGLLTVTA